MGKLSDSKDEIARLYFEEGWSYQAIANLHGKSREAVRVFLNRHFPDREAGTAYRQRLREEERATQEAEALEARLKDAPPCAVCFKPVIKKTDETRKNWTCCHEHSILWSRARFLLDDDIWERQIHSTAQSILRYPEMHEESEVAWAKRIASGTATPRRRFIREGSKAQQAYEEVLRIRKEGNHECH